MDGFAGCLRLSGLNMAKNAETLGSVSEGMEVSFQEGFMEGIDAVCNHSRRTRHECQSFPAMCPGANSHGVSLEMRWNVA